MCLKVGLDTEVKLHFTLSLETGERIDSTLDAQPAEFVVGDGQILPGFERKLMGLSSGAKRSFLIPAQDAFGLPKEENRFLHKKKELGPITQDIKSFVPGLVLGFQDAKGEEVPAVVIEIYEDDVLIDFNHPLAGKNIVFVVEILDVQPVPEVVTLQTHS